MKKQLALIAAVIFTAGSLVFTGCKKDDVTAPVVTVTGTNPMYMAIGGTYVEAGATATDDEDGDLTSSITTSGTVDNSVAGTYTITYSATDAAGNTGTATRTVIVANASANLAGSYTVVDVCPGLPTTTYTETISASSTTNNRIITTKFANYVNATVYMNISGSTVSIPSQTVTSGNPSASRTFTGSGTISGTTITITYTENTGGTSTTCDATYTKN